MMNTEGNARKGGSPRRQPQRHGITTPKPPGGGTRQGTRPTTLKSERTKYEQRTVGAREVFKRTHVRCNKEA